jgi:DNA-binding IclR family transcriptional regulator
VASWSVLTKHGRALVYIAHDPGVRLRDIAANLGITERSAFGIVSDLTEAGYLVKVREGRRNRYRVQAHLPLEEAVGRQATVGHLLDLLIGAAGTERTRAGAGTPARGGAATGRPPTR